MITSGRPTAPMWDRGPAMLDTAMFVVMALALSVETVRMFASGHPIGGWTSLVTSAIGVCAIGRRPVVALLCVSISPIAGALLGWDTITTWTIACFASSVLALRGLPAIGTGVVTSACVLAASGITGGSIAPSVNPTASIAAFAALVTTTVGSSIRAHRQYWFELEQRTHDAITTRAAAVDRAIAEERVDIARDLHDSVGHHIAVVSMHLGSAEVHLPRDADNARLDLQRARAGVQAVLRETQQILNVLHASAESDAGSPTASHALIPKLVETFESAGMVIDSTLSGLSSEIAPSVSTAAYRITQEALTNAQRHGSGSVSLTVDVPDEGDAIVEVVNARNVVAPADSGNEGHGLVGMKERATSIGGTLEARPEGSLFRVHARIPLNGSRVR